MRRTDRLLLLAFCTLLLAIAQPPASVAQVRDSITTPPAEPDVEKRADPDEKDVPYVPTSPSVVERMLKVAGVTREDVVYDLGSGDGRIPITAAKEFGARAVGVEIDSSLVDTARSKAAAAGVTDKVTFHRGDLFDADLSEATVVTLYLFPEINLKLRPKLLRELDPGDRIVSHDFRMGNWQPDSTVEAGRGNTGWEVIYLWRVPETVPDALMDISDELEKK